MQPTADIQAQRDCASSDLRTDDDDDDDGLVVVVSVSSLFTFCSNNNNDNANAISRASETMPFCIQCARLQCVDDIVVAVVHKLHALSGLRKMRESTTRILFCNAKSSSTWTNMTQNRINA